MINDIKYVYKDCEIALLVNAQLPGGGTTPILIVKHLKSNETIHACGKTEANKIAELLNLKWKIWEADVNNE